MKHLNFALANQWFCFGKRVSAGRWELQGRARMIQQERIPWRFGIHASVIQLLALFIAGTSVDGGTTLNASALASLGFWSCAVSLLWWHRGRASRTERLFLRWGLLAFVLIGTPL